MDIYIKNSGDPNFNPRALESQDDIDILIEQINMLLYTEKTEVLGEHQMGSGLEGLIYEFNLTAGQIERTLEEQIEKYIPMSSNYNIEVKCQFYKGTVRDIATLDVLINSTPVTGVTIN